MTANIFAPLLNGVPRHKVVFRNGALCLPSGNWPDSELTAVVRVSDVLAALAAAVPDDLAEAGKVLERDANVDPWVDHQERNGALAAWCREGVPALLARIAAMEAQIKGLEAALTKINVGEGWAAQIARNALREEGHEPS